MTWKKKRREWDDIFDEFFGRSFGYFDEIVEKMFKDLDEFFRSASKGEMKPFVKGFSIRIGPDGRPEIKEFGSKPEIISKEGIEERKPLIDVMEGDEDVHVIAEMPGVNKEDIDVNASDTTVEIKAEGETRKYYERADLPCEVIPDSAKARYNNGVLEIIFKKRHPRKDDLKKIKIE
jgi:HSP20 family protein